MAGKTSPKIRLHVSAPLAPGAGVPLTAQQAHYLRNVMRRGVGEPLALFNGRDGEWSAGLETLERQQATARCLECLRPQVLEPDLWLAFAPVKKARLDIIVEKATELGAARLLPVITRHTDVERVNTERLAANAREAAEQSQRLGVPQVDAPCRLGVLLAGWPAGRPLIFADETGGAPALQALAASPGAAAGILIGPEGGFAAEERQALKSHAEVTAVSLGPRILRAETAVISLMTLWQCVNGDWADRHSP